MANPEAMLPCPICAASVKGKNLSAHIDKVHVDEVAPSARWRGTDRALIRPLFALFAACLLQLPLLGLVPSALQRWFVWAVAAQMTVFLGGLALTVFGKLPAEAVLEGNRLVVRYGLGLLRRSVSLESCSVEVGTLIEARARTYVQGLPDGATDDVKVGSYLRVRGKRGCVTFGTRTGTGLRKHWSPSGWSSRGTVRLWDITLDPGAVVALEYLLAHRGMFTPR